MYQVNVASGADAEEVSVLRRKALVASREFSLHDVHKADWADIDESSVVLIVRDGDVLVSSLRMIVFSDARAAERFLEYPVARWPIEGPILVMSRAVTLPSHFSKGFMGALRYGYLRGLLQTKIESVVAIVYQGAPRVNSMRRAGFELSDCPEHWDSEAKVMVSPLIGVLRRPLFEQALAHTESEFAKVIGECTFNWVAIHARFAQVPSIDA